MRPTNGECLNSEESIARLPEYEHPPVVETALAVEFASLPGWNIIHYGLLRQRFQEAYPNFEVHPAAFIPFPPTVAVDTVPLTIDIANPPIRCFFISEDGTQLVQIRNGALAHNWRKQPENDIYPRYDTIRPAFVDDLRIFYRFLQDNGFSAPEVWKCEVTYVNHFLRGREWSDIPSLLEVLPAIRLLDRSQLLTRLTQMQFTFNYELPEDIGNLRIQLLPFLGPDGKELAQLTLTAFGRPRSNDPQALIEWIDAGREAVVRGFSEFTSEDAQTKTWRRIWP